MGGITGWANLDPKQPPLFGEEERLSLMCGRMWHRGRDSEEMWLGEGVALGMRGFEISNNSRQLAWNRDKSVVATMDGRIYNFRELKKGLQERGYKFHSESDTEIIPHLYDELGEAFLDVLNGMFAIVLWDTKLEKLILARDRFGEKPLYYGVFSNKLFFASEPKVLLSHPDINTEVNLEALHHYLSYDYVPAPLSIYKGIHKLPAAHRLVWENGKIKTIRYWRLSFQKNGKKTLVKEASESLREKLSESVKLRLDSDIPLGVLLSGEMDSSVVATFAQQNTSKKIKTFSIGFEGSSSEESKFAKEFAKHLGTEHFEENLSLKKAKNLIREIGKWFDEPLSNGFLLPTFLLSKIVSENVKVALSGDGSDELFAGHPIYAVHKGSRFNKLIPDFVHSGVIEPIFNNLANNKDDENFVNSAKYEAIQKHHTWFGSFSDEEKKKLLNDSVQHTTKGIDIYKETKDLLQVCDAENQIEQMQFWDMNYYLAEDVLTRTDRASMKFSLEIRNPFLDHNLAEYVASLPAEYKLKGKIAKFILKKSVEDLLPKNIIEHSKKDFRNPIAEWLKGNLNYLVHEMLSPDKIIIQGFFNVDYIQELIREHEQGIANHYKKLWTLLIFQFWYENFMSETKKSL